MEKLAELYREFKDSNDIMTPIVDGMPLKRSKKSIIDKMVEVGLIRDKSEVKKKRVRGAKRNQRIQDLNRTNDDDEGLYYT